MTYQSLTNAAYWLDSLIAPGGLLLGVVLLFAVLVLILRMVLGKKKTKLGCEKYFGRKVTF